MTVRTRLAVSATELLSCSLANTTGSEYTDATSLPLCPKNPMYTIYGISNCDTVKKAINWLKEANIPFHFHDYKKSGISKKQLKTWSSQVGFEKLLNPKSTTWRGLPEAEKALAAEESGAIQLMTLHTSLIKRPLIEKEGKVLLLGFDAKVYKALLK